MIIFKKFKDYSDFILNSTNKKATIGFVPTMGALHDGHLSLIKESKATTDITVCSIFINPTQFNNPSDLQKYPVTIENDIYLLENNGCDILLLPDNNEVYPPGHMQIKYELGPLEDILEGYFRPGHFQGVCEVVNRLLTEVMPDILFLGQKDFQQCMVIKRLLSLISSNVALQIIPTIREKSGLARSSRNLRLSEDEKKSAAIIFEVLNYINQNIRTEKLQPLKNNSIKILEKAGFTVDYVEVASANDLSIINKWDQHTKMVALVAATINGVRLIDNILLS